MTGVVVVDANLMLLLVVGAASRDYIGKHKRLEGYTVEDFELLGLLPLSSRKSSSCHTFWRKFRAWLDKSRSPLERATLVLHTALIHWGIAPLITRRNSNRDSSLLQSFSASPRFAPLSEAMTVIVCPFRNRIQGQC